MTTKAEQRFEEDYLYVRRELICGRNPFVTPQSMKDWIQSRVDAVVANAVRERMARAERNMSAHADRELEIYHSDLKKNGEKEDGDE